jgi:hypothetical protein
MKGLWGCEVLLNAFVTLTLGRSEWSASSPGYIIPVDTVTVPLYRVDPRVDAVAVLYPKGDGGLGT